MRSLSTLIATGIALWLGACLWQLLHYAPNTAAWGSRYVLRSLHFSLSQASYSTAASLLLALPLLWGALAGRLQWLRHLLPITTILPTLLFILITLDLTQWFNQQLGQNIQLRGMHGIVLLHALLNAPLLALLLLPSVERIPENYHKQRQLLRLNAWRYVYRVLLPLLRPALWHGLSLVFLLCFTSFTTPLILGGDPRYANLEVAIYQAVKYEFNLPLAAQLALLQIAVLLPLFALMPQQPPAPPHSQVSKRFVRVSATVCECGGLLLLLSPLALLLYYGIQHFDPKPPPALFRAIFDSLTLALLTVPPAVLLHILLVQQSRTFMKRLIEALYLMPTLILCLGTYLLAKPYVSLFAYPQLANSVLLTLTVQPYLYKLALPAWQQHQQRYQRLCANLGLSSWTRWWQVDLPALAPVLAKVAGLAAIVCVGDVAIARFYTNTHFQTLAAYLSEELGHYRHQRAWQTSSYFLLLSLCLYWLPHALAKLYSTLRKP